MAKLFNRAKMTTATTGSGTVTLGSASNGFQTFAAAGVSNGDVVQYVIEEGANFEIGTGTYSSSGTSLTRSPTESSNSNNAITLAGQATVSITAVADDLNRLQHGGSDKVTVSSTGASVTGNLSVSGTVDGRDVANDGSKLDGIEANAKNDQTITAGDGLTGGGTGDVTISHSDTSSQASVNGSGRTYIQDVTLDAYGHVTGLATGTETVVNTDTNTTDWRVQNSGGTEQFAVSAAEGVRFAGSGATSVAFDASTQKITISSTDTNTDTDTIPNNATITLTAGDALTGGGNFTTDQSSNETITFNHSDTSSQSSVNNSSGTVIQDVTLDGYGHVTGLASVNLDGRYYTESESDTRFLRGNTSDTMTGNLTVDNGTSTTLSVKCNDGGNAIVKANGDSQGTGALEVGQSDTYGGGISYNGDGSPAFVSGESSDNITFYRLENGTRTEVFHYPYNSNTVNFNSTPTAGGVSLAKTTDIGNGTLTVQGTGALGGSGTFTANQSGNTTISISHDDTSSQASVNNSGRTYIQDITLDEYGHITGISSATETVTNTNTNQLTTFVVEDGDGTEVTISHGKEWKFVEGGGIDINWTDTSTGSDGDPFDLTISHLDTSSQASVNNSGGTVIQDVTLDGYGHVTGLTSYNLDGRYYTETEADSRFVNVTGDTMTGPLEISTSTNEHLILSGATDPYIRFQEGTTDKAMIQWSDSGVLQFRNQENGKYAFWPTVTAAAELVLLRNDTTTTSGEDLGSVNFGHTDGSPDFPTQTVAQLPARILAEASETTSSGDDGARLSFYTKPTNGNKDTNSIERVRIDQDGTSRFYGDIEINSGGASGSACLQINNSSSSTFNKAIEALNSNLTSGESEQFMMGRALSSKNVADWRFQYSSSGSNSNFMSFGFWDVDDVLKITAGRITTVDGTFNNTSDKRLKENIKPIENALSDICQLEGVTFDWKESGVQGQGFIAQQVEPIIPEVVNTDADSGIKSINYVGLIGHLVEAIKSQQTQIDDLKAEIQSMKS
jgi:hypothetical protein